MPFLVGQRLVKRLCPQCRQPHRRSDAIIEQYGHILEMAKGSGVLNAADGVRYRLFEAGGGCNACNRSGFVGRSGIFECRNLCSPVAELLQFQGVKFDPTAAESALSKAITEGDLEVRTMREDGILKAFVGITAPEEVFGATMDGSREI